MPKTLYICYFGVREPLVQTQVIPYLREIMKDGVEVSLVTFEPEFRKSWAAVDIEKQRAELAGVGIKWYALGYHKRPTAPATAWDILAGAWFVRKLLKREKFDILHGRVHVPTLMGALARKFSSHKPKPLFDIRGFFPEEYTDAGRWPENGWLYRSAKRVERWLMKEADGFVVLTEKARGILFGDGTANAGVQNGRPVEVIPCCVDFDGRFAGDAAAMRAAVRKELGIEDRRVITYVGSFGGWYLTDEMLDFFAAAREQDPRNFAMILTQREQEKIAEKLRSRGFDERDFFVGSVSPTELPGYLAAADVAISFIKACYSKQSSSPTKIAEYLAGGLPIIANRGVGDIDELIERNRVGALIDGFSHENYLNALDAIEKLGPQNGRYRETAAREFDLEAVGGLRYRRLYTRILELN